MARSKKEKKAAKALDAAKDAVAKAKRLAEKADRSARKKAAKVEAKLAVLEAESRARAAKARAGASASAKPSKVSTSKPKAKPKAKAPKSTAKARASSAKAPAVPVLTTPTARAVATGPAPSAPAVKAPAAAASAVTAKPATSAKPAAREASGEGACGEARGDEGRGDQARGGEAGGDEAGAGEARREGAGREADRRNHDGHANRLLERPRGAERDLPAPARARARHPRLLAVHEGATRRFLPRLKLEGVGWSPASCAGGTRPPFRAGGHVTADVPGILDRSALAAPPRTLIDVLRATTLAHPDASALEDADGALSYRELMARVVRTAARLSAAGVRRGDRVGIRMPSGSRELYIAILGAMAAGAAYVPVDADDPEERARLVFGEARVRGVIGGRGAFEPTSGAVEPDASPEALFDGTPPHPSTHATPVATPPGLDDDAWIIFTSGSTGTPKGVAVTHRSAAAFVDAEAGLFLQEAPLGPGDRVLAGLSVAFDASCEEMWLAWRHGACLVPAPRSLVRSGMDLGPWMVTHGISVVSTVPTLAALWPAEAIENVRLLIFGGEAVPPELAARLVSPEREVWNTYGPTEATVVACAAILDGIGPVRIGLPLDGWALAVVDAEGHPVADGETGELIIGGVGLARYLDPEKDAAKYSPMPTLGWERAYRSGDLVVFDREGLLFQGRADDQVKVGGRRIELGEIESALQALPAVSGAAAAVRRTEAGNQVLVGYLSVTDGFDRAAAGPASSTSSRPRSCRCSRSSTSSRPAPPARSTAPPCPGRCPVSSPTPRGSGHPPPGSPSSGRPCSECPCRAGRELLRPRRRVARGGAAGQPHPDPRPGVHRRRHLRPPPPRLDGRRARGAGARARLGRVHLPAADPDAPGHAVGADARRRSALHPERRAMAPVPAHGDDDPRRGDDGFGFLPTVPLWVLLVGLAIFATPFGRMAIAIAAARLLLAGLEPGDYPRGGAVHLRMWLAEQIAHQVDAVGLAGAPWVSYYARALGARIGADVDLHTLPPVTGMLDDRRRRRDRARGRPRRHWIDGDVVRIGGVRIGAGSTVGARSTLLPGTRIGKGAEIAPGSAVFGRVPAGQRWAGCRPSAIGPRRVRGRRAAARAPAGSPPAAFVGRSSRWCRSRPSRLAAWSSPRASPARDARRGGAAGARVAGAGHARSQASSWPGSSCRGAAPRPRRARGAACRAQPHRLAGVDDRAAARPRARCCSRSTPACSRPSRCAY